MPAGFRRHLVGKSLRHVCYSVVTLSRQVTDYVLNLLVNFFNNMVNLHPLTPYIMPSYTHKMANVS